MSFETYTPHRLIQAKNDIAMIHDTFGTPNVSKEDNSLRELIMRLSGLELYQVRRAANVLTENECRIVAAYLPFNYFSVDMKNLFLIFQYRSNDRMCEILYSQWQDSYDNKDCNQHIMNLLNVDERFIMHIRANNITESLYSDILKSESIPIRYGEEIKSRVYDNARTLAEKANAFGIRSDSRLFHMIQFLFYTFCEREDYLAVDKTVLSDVVQKYDDVAVKKFLVNFLTKLSLKELEKYDTVANYLHKYKTSDPGTTKFESFFVGISKDLIRKYTDWINIYKVNQYFGYDDRSLFWKQYRFINVYKYNRSNSVVMEMENYYATEFLGKAAGPIYFYDKDIFNNHIRRWFEREDNKELRSTLYQSRDRYAAYRKEHNANWQRTINGILINNHMTEKIRL